MPSSESSIQRKARLFAKICAGSALAYLLIHALVSGRMNIGGMILLLYGGIIAVISDVVRKRGSPRRVAAFLPNVPMGVLMICAMVFGDTERKIGLQLLPYWVVAGLFLMVGLLVSTTVVFIIPKRRDTSA